MGELDSLFLKEGMQNKQIDTETQALTESGQNSYDTLSRSVFGIPSADAGSRYIRSLDTSLNRDIPNYILISLLLDRGLSFEEIFDPNAKRREKSALGEELKKIAAGTAEEKNGYYDKVKAAVIRQFDTVYEFAEEALNACDRKQPGADKELYEKLDAIKDGMFDFIGQHLTSSKMFKGENGQKNYELYKKDGETFEELQTRFSDMDFKLPKLKAHFLNTLRNRHMAVTYLSLADQDKFLTTVRQYYVENILSDWIYKNYQPPHDVKKNDTFTTTLRIAQTMVYNTLSSPFFNKLSKEETAVFLTTPELLDRIQIHFTKNPFELTDLEQSNYTNFADLLIRDKNGKETFVNLANAVDMEAKLADLVKDVKAKTKERLRCGEQECVNRLGNYFSAIPEKLYSYRNLLYRATDASSEISSEILEFEKQYANSVMAGEKDADPYRDIMIGNRSARAVLGNVFRFNGMRYETASADVKRGLLTAIVLCALKNHIPVSAVYGRKPSAFDYDAVKISFSLPKSADRLSYEGRSAVEMVFDDIRYAFSKVKNAEELASAHKKLVDHKTEDIKVRMNQAYMKGRAYMREGAGTFNGINAHELIDWVRNDIKLINDLENGRGEKEKEGYTFSNGLKLSRETSILAIAFSYEQNDGIEKGQSISQINILQNNKLQNALERATKELDARIAAHERNPKENDLFMREVIAKALPRITAMDQNNAFPNSTDLINDARRHVMNLRTKYDLLNFVDKDTDSVSIDGKEGTLKEHLKNTPITTDAEMAEFEYVKAIVCMNNLYDNKQVGLNLDRAKEHVGHMLYYWGHKKENPSPIALSSMSAVSAEAAKFGKEYLKQRKGSADTKVKATIYANDVANAQNQLTTDLEHPEETYAYTEQVRVYGEGSRKIEQLREKYKDIQFFDHDGQPLGDDDVFKPNVTYAAWTPENGLNGVMLNTEGKLIPVPLDFSDQVQSGYTKEFNDWLDRRSTEIEAERRLDRLFGFKAEPSKKMPHATEVIGSVISCSDAFKNAAKGYSKEVVAALVMGAALAKDKIDQLITSSSGFGDSYEGKEYFYMTNWVMSYDPRSENFGKNHKKAREEVNDLLKNYDPGDPAQRTHYEELLKNAVKNAAYNVLGADTVQHSEPAMRLYTAFVINDALKTENAEFLEKLDPEDLRLIRLGAAMYQLITTGDRALGKLFRKQYETDEEKQELILQAAAVKFVTKFIENRNEEIRNLAFLKLGTENTKRFKAGDIMDLDRDMLPEVGDFLHHAIIKNVPCAYELALAEDHGVENLIKLVGEKLLETKEGQNLLLMPDICLAGKMTELADPAKDTAKNIQGKLEADLPQPKDLNTETDKILPQYLEMRDDAFEKNMQDFPLTRERWQNRNEMKAEERRAFDMSALTKMDYTNVRQEQFDLVTDAMKKCLIGNSGLSRKKIQKLTDALEKLEPHKSQGGVDNPQMYTEASKLSKLCMEMLAEEKNPEAVKNLNRFFAGSESIRSTCDEGIRENLISEVNIKAGRVSPQMLEYFMDARETLEKMKKQFEDHDPFYLPSNQLVRNFKRALDDAATAARESSETFSFNEEQRLKVKNCLLALKGAANAAKDHLHPISGIGKKRLDIIKNIGTRAEDMVEKYNVNFREENRNFSAKKSEYLLKDEKLRIDNENKEKQLKERIRWKKAYEDFMDFKNKLPIHASTPKELRQFFEEIPLHLVELSKMPNYYSEGDFKDAFETYLSLPIAKLVIARGIIEERAKGEADTIADALLNDSEALYDKVQESEYVKGLVTAAKNDQMEKYIYDHGADLKTAVLKAANPEPEAVEEAEPDYEDPFEARMDEAKSFEKAPEPEKVQEKTDNRRNVSGAGRLTI